MSTSRIFQFAEQFLLDFILLRPVSLETIHDIEGQSIFDLWVILEMLGISHFQDIFDVELCKIAVYIELLILVSPP